MNEILENTFFLKNDVPVVYYERKNLKYEKEKNIVFFWAFFLMVSGYAFEHLPWSMRDGPGPSARSL